MTACLASIELPRMRFPSEREHKSLRGRSGVDRYPVAQFPARGHVARPLPLDGGPDGDRELMLTKAHLHQRPAAPRATAKPLPPKTARSHRAASTVAPELVGRAQAPCLPAIHVTPTTVEPRLWIHAPAVAERLNGGSSLDQWLQEQSEAVCLGDTWQPACSATTSRKASTSTWETQDAISLRVDVDADGHLGEWEFQLSTVRPVASVTSDALASIWPLANPRRVRFPQR